jgi:RimJ/RimL family protein N-acetyltransferase
MRAASPASPSFASPSSQAQTPAFFAIARDEVFRLETKRLWLRWPHHTDATAIAAWAGLAEVADMMWIWPVGVDAVETARRIEDSRSQNSAGIGLRLALTAKSQPHRVIGQIGIRAVGDGVGRVGFHLDPALHNQSLMTEALARVLQIAAQLSTLRRIEAGVRLINPASRRVLEKCGFAHTGQSLLSWPERGDTPVNDFALTLPPRLKRALAA